MAPRTAFVTGGPGLVEGSRNLIDAAFAAGVRRMVHSSTWHTYWLEQGEISEHSPQLGGRSWINYDRKVEVGDECAPKVAHGPLQRQVERGPGLLVELAGGGSSGGSSASSARRAGATGRRKDSPGRWR